MCLTANKIHFFQEFDSKRKESEQRGNKSKTWFVLDQFSRKFTEETRVLINTSNWAELKSILAPVLMYTPGYPFNR